MENNSEELWIISSRPKSLDEMLLTDEMDNIIKNVKDNHTLVHGPIGSGKTVFAEALTNFNARIVSCKSSNDVEYLLKNANEINSVIIKNIDQFYDGVGDIIEAYKTKKVFFVTRDETSADLNIFKDCKKIHTYKYRPWQTLKNAMKPVRSLPST